jgi:hypothetical protein
MTLYTNRVASYALLLVSLWLACAGRNAEGDEPAKPPFKVGESVRFNKLDILAKAPDMIQVRASFEDYRSNTIRFLSSDEKAKFALIREHEDQVFVGHNTLATVTEIKSFKVDGKTFVVAHVNLKSGALKGQKCWVGVQRLRRANEPNPAEPTEIAYSNMMEFEKSLKSNAVPKTESAKMPLSSPIRDSKLVLTDLTPSEEGGSTYITGRFRNTSGEDLKGTWAQVHFEDSKGKLIRMNSGICLPGVVAPGETGSFRVLQDDDCRGASIRITFSDLQSSISWTDESGKNAHP